MRVHFTVWHTLIYLSRDGSVISTESRLYSFIFYLIWQTRFLIVSARWGAYSLRRSYMISKRFPNVMANCCDICAHLASGIVHFSRMFRYARYTSFSREASKGKAPLFFVTLRTFLSYPSTCTLSSKSAQLELQLSLGLWFRIINKKVYLHNDNKKEFFSKS